MRTALAEPGSVFVPFIVAMLAIAATAQAAIESETADAVDDINNNVGFWAPQPDFRIPERLSLGSESFPDEDLKAIHADLEGHPPERCRHRRSPRACASSTTGGPDDAPAVAMTITALRRCAKAYSHARPALCPFGERSSDTELPL